MEEYSALISIQTAFYALTMQSSLKNEKMESQSQCPAPFSLLISTNITTGAASIPSLALLLKTLHFQIAGTLETITYKVLKLA